MCPALCPPPRSLTQPACTKPSPLSGLPWNRSGPRRPCFVLSCMLPPCVGDSALKRSFAVICAKGAPAPLPHTMHAPRAFVAGHRWPDPFVWLTLRPERRPETPWAVFDRRRLPWQVVYRDGFEGPLEPARGRGWHRVPLPMALQPAGCVGCASFCRVCRVVLSKLDVSAASPACRCVQQ